MKLELIRYFLLGLIFIVSSAQAAYELKDLDIIKNDKEAISVSIGQKDAQKIKEKFVNSNVNREIKSAFAQALLKYLNSDNLKCELSFVQNFQEELEKRSIFNNQETIYEYFKYLRVSNLIDDLLYDFAVGIAKDYFSLQELSSEDSASTGLKFYSKEKLTKDNDVKDLYKNFESWPADQGLCVYQEFAYIRDHLKTKHEKPDYKQKLKVMRRLNVEAHSDGKISASTYKRLEYLRKESFLNTRYIWLKDYFDVIFKAKNKMVAKNDSEEILDISREDKFSTDRLKRFSKLTRRKHLYEKYDETQIILLAQVLQKASRRMGTDPDVNSGVPYITQEFEILNESGEKENYVERIELDPQSQYNLARKRMRKDILDLQVMDIFFKVEIHYSEIVMAALETGYITLEDIEYVVTYDDLWNPATTKFQRIMKFIFNTARVATFFVPAPFNITTSIAITVVEGVVDSKNRKGADNDNPASIID